MYMANNSRTLFANVLATYIKFLTKSILYYSLHAGQFFIILYILAIY